MSNNVITHGVIYGLISALLSFLSFNGIITGGLMSILPMIIFIIVLISTGKKYKANHDGFASMGDLVKTFAAVLIIGLLMSTIFQLAYTTMVGEEKKEAFIENMIEGQMETYGKFLPEEGLEDMEEQMYNQISGMFEPSGILMGLLLGGSLIPAAIMKRNPEQHL